MTAMLDVIQSAKDATENISDPIRYNNIVESEQLSDEANSQFNSSFVI